MYVEEKREAEAPVVESQERKVILLAIDILSGPGVWVCGNPVKIGRGHCLSTALQRAAWSINPKDQEEGCLGALSDSVHFLVTSQLGTNIVRWNDTPGRTLDDVLGLLRKTAELL